MTTRRFPPIEDVSMAPTRDALHAYARVLGAWLKTCRPRRKHWWHASLRPSLNGLTTGVVHSDIDFEMELDLRASRLQIRTASGEHHSEPLVGQSAHRLAASVSDSLTTSGIDSELAATIGDGFEPGDGFDGYSGGQASLLADVLGDVTAGLQQFRAGIREETSPIQVWPHHFDLSMLWLPGETIPGEDPADEEASDKQLNFGFTFGDEGIAEPYFYITAYPLPEALPETPLPAGTTWHSGPFNGAVLPYRVLTATQDPAGYLADLCGTLLAAGRERMLDKVP
jgi:hypothetical protein